MSDSAQPAKESLWRAGFKLFRENWRAWAKIAVWFFLAFTVLGWCFDYLIASPEHTDLLKRFSDAKKAHQDLSAADQDAIHHLTMQGIAVGVVYCVGVLVQSFLYIVFFLGRAPQLGKPEYSAERFFGWLGTYMVLMLLLIGFMAVSLGALMGIDYAIAQAQLAFWAKLAAGILAGVIFIHIAVRLYPVMVLTVGDVRPVFRTSWEITRGNFWRLLGNSLMFMLIVMLIMIAAIIAGAIVIAVIGVMLHAAASSADATAKAIPLYLQAALNALVTTGMHGALWSFYSAATAILYREKYPGGLRP